jgi:hypothetical protein
MTCTSALCGFLNTSATIIFSQSVIKILIKVVEVPTSKRTDFAPPPPYLWKGIAYAA